MSKFLDQTETEGYKCPYCLTMYTCDDWGYDYNGENMECEECGKHFYATANHSVDFASNPDCELNGEKHDLELYKENTYICKMCDKMVIIRQVDS